MDRSRQKWVNYRCLLHIIFLCVLSSQLAEGFDIKSYYHKHSRQSQEEFVKNFPYDQYLQAVPFTDFGTLQAHRYYLWTTPRKDGDDFLYYLGENFIKQYPLTLEKKNLEGKIAIGEAYLKAAPTGNHSADAIYDIIGYYVLGKVAQTIEKAISQGKFDPDVPANTQLIKRLEQSDVYVTIERSSMKKLIEALKRGDVDYVVNRGWLKARTIVDKVGNRYQHVLGNSFFDDFFITKSASPSPQTTNAQATSTFTLSNFQQYYCDNVDCDFNILAIQDSSQAIPEIGHCLWLVRPNVKATYFAHKTRQTVFQRYRNWIRGKQVILATTGGFTNQFRQPEGLTIEKGEIVNAVLMPDRHGLVIVHDSGGISVINLKRDEIKLSLGPATVLPIKNPLHSLIDFSKLLEWCKKHKATLFQTQLLAYSDALLIQPHTAKTQLRERRILTLISDKSSGQVAHVVFNITQDYNLADIAREIFDFFTARNQKIEAMLNLDVGAYDILYVFDPNGSRLSQVRGKWNTDITTATNLIVYTR